VAKKKKEEKPKEYTRRQLSHFKQQQRRHRIVFISGITVITAIILIVLGGWFATDFYPLHRNVLEVNGVKFNVGYYLDVMRVMKNSNSTADAGTLSNSAYQAIMQGELIREGAAKLGVSVSKSEIKKWLADNGQPDNRGARGYYSSQLLIKKLQDGYFSSQVPETGDQVHPLMMMLESVEKATEIRERLANGDNFTALASEFGQDYYSQNVNQGDFGMHVRDVLKDQVSSAVPLDYAFSAPVGELSQPLSDNETYKQSGYWLIKLVDRPEEGKVNVQALFVGNEALALDVRARLEAGTAALSDMADKYSEYSVSKDKHGDLGVIDVSDNSTFTKAFGDYVFNPESPTGGWSQPIHDTELWTQGGFWLVKVLEKQENARISDDDRNQLIQTDLNNWYSTLSSAPDLKVNSDLLTPEIRQWVVDRFNKEYPVAQGQ
jgi:parvulin-like peptidyl-prolyl isomerase